MARIHTREISDTEVDVMDGKTLIGWTRRRTHTVYGGPNGLGGVHSTDYPVWRAEAMTFDDADYPSGPLDIGDYDSLDEAVQAITDYHL